MPSCIDCPRTASGDCSPSAHRTASVMFDLPEPLGPTITDTPGPNSSLVRSGKDLKPLRVSDFRCTAGMVAGASDVRCRIAPLQAERGLPRADRVGVELIQGDAGGLL